ncbi:hypothetical protein PG997_007749 [Apiospora hydei]|uniref:Mitochondrial ribosomal protein MRP51 n=1 Tax=Apiospora hydei TaxID=1337664 RepID=A0ABR1W8X1_9PEZI
MASTQRAVSPGAALLRSSRLFSMPAPIAPPPGDMSQATKHKSETATAAFPTHLTVTTPSTSRLVGDWGFKRPLPLKTTTKSTFPLVRVKKVDSIEHVTDFQSASDHTITLEKFREMNLSFSVPTSKDRQGNPTLISVFEESRDFTTPAPSKLLATPNGSASAWATKDDGDPLSLRWKFRGPWLAGMTDGEFDRYIAKSVRARRSEFRQFLRERLAAEKTADRNSSVSEQDASTPTNAIPSVTADEITEEELLEYTRRLRGDRHELFNLVSRFLDLAPSYDLYRDSPYASEGPPITHPSAGLSYLRTQAFMENHPIYGPQKSHASVKARIVTPRFGITNQNPKIGVGGFIANIPSHETTFSNKRRHALSAVGNNNSITGLNDFDPSLSGGAKVYVQVQTANVDATGKIQIRLLDNDLETDVVQKELVGECDTFGGAVKEAAQPKLRSQPTGDRRYMGKRTSGSASNYGLGNLGGRDL